MRALALAALAASLVTPGHAPASGSEAPRLVVLLAIDQLRRDRLDPELPGGLGRLAREGRVYTEGVLDHARTETCPGHASIATGRHPGPIGVPGNSHTDRDTGASVYCVEDASPQAAVLAGSGGRSPALLDATALGDWLKQARPESRVYSVAGKDRTAITLGGQHPDGVYWFARGTGFTTSRHYRDALPDWAAALNETLLERVPEQWVHASIGDERPDDFAGESPDYSRTSPHPLWDDDFAVFTENLYFTPQLDLLTIDVARELVRREDLGADEHPDLLAVGLSATDTIGHLYGPGSQESQASLRLLDAALGEFLAELEESVGRGRVLVALSADHGVLPLPEWLEQTGQAECPVQGGRAGLRTFGLGLRWRLHRRLQPFFSLPAEWLHIAGSALTVNRALAAERGVEVREVVRVAEEYLEEQAVIREAWTADEIARGSDDLARLYRNSWHPERGGDLLVQLEPGCLLSPWSHGTTHGTPYLHDRAVPIVFWGSGVRAARVPGPATTVDIAPTLARRLGIAAGDDLDGHALFE